MSRWAAGLTSDAALAVAADLILYVRPGGNDSADGLSWKTAKQTLAAAITALPSGGVIEIAGQHDIAEALPQPANETLIRGRGNATRINWTGAGTMLTITSGRQIHFENLRFFATSAGQTVFYLSNTFRCSWLRVTVDGQHTNLTGTTYHGQVGFQFRGNSGDNQILACHLNNLGEAVQSDTIMNYMVGCVVNNNWRGLHVDAGASTGGMSIHQSTFSGTAIGAAAVQAHILIDVAANQTWLTDSWFEGCTTAIQAGASGVGGPVGMVIRDCKLAATSKCLDIQAGRQYRLDSVRFSADASATPTELTINATDAPDGFAAGLISTTTFDIARSVFPANWTYLPRYTSDAQVAGYNLRIGASVGAGTPSYYQSGGDRARFGYDGSRTVMSSAGGDRDAAIIAGAANRQAVLGTDGVLYVGQKTQGTSNAGGAVVALVIQDAVTLPTTNVSGGGVLYVDNGALKYRGKGGTVTTLGNS